MTSDFVGHVSYVPYDSGTYETCPTTLMYPHRIRLLGPWDCDSIGASAQPAPPHVTPPIRFQELGLCGQLRLIRRFGYPGRIDPYEHVWLTFADVADRAAITLNDQPIGTEL